MKKILTILLFAAALLTGCNKDQWPAQPDWDRIPDPTKPVDDGLPKPKDASTIVVAHRGGSSECGAPDNSIESLKYAKEVGAYGSECDAYYTKDNNVIIAHADGSYQVNGLNPFEHTVAEIRAAGKLSNGEDIPTLDDFLDVILDTTSCTRLVIDVKKLDTQNLDYVSKCAKRVSEIITERKAKHFVIMLCTGTNSNVMQLANSYAYQADVPIAFNSSKSPAQYATLGLGWANLSAAGNMYSAAGGTGSCNPNDYVNNGIKISVYNVDKQAGDGNAVYSEEAVNYYMKNLGLFSMICSNYPSWLIKKIESGSKYYDGISSAEEFEIFKTTVATDPTASHFQNDKGEVVLKTDLTIKDATPVAQFTGVFDGNGHTVTFDYTGSDTQAGFFKTLRGTVKNLKLSGKMSCIKAPGAEAHWGALASRVYDGVTVSDCSSSVEISYKYGETSAVSAILLSGFVGKVWSGITMERCTYTGSITFEAADYSLIGAMVAGTNADEGCTFFNACKSSANISYNGTDASSWHYIGGLIGKPQSSLLMGSTYGLKAKDCEMSGTITINGAAKVRGGGIAAYSKACNYFSGCTFKGKIAIGAAALERNVGGICGFQEASCQGLFENCTFDGQITCASGATKAFWMGGITSTGYNAATVIDGCKTTKNSSIANLSLGSVGMIAGRPNNALTIKNCKIAGTINKGGEVTTLTADKLEDWMFKGSATTAECPMSGNGYNN